MASTLTELRAECLAHIADTGNDGHLPDLIRQVARQARAHGLPAEQVVAAFGSVWDDLPDVGHVTQAVAEDVRWSFVSALITAYYDGDHSTRQPGT